MNETSKKRIECLTCRRKVSKKHYVNGMTSCADCVWDELIEQDYKRCRVCLNWSKGEVKETCAPCREKANKASTKFKRKNGVIAEDAKLECINCGKLSFVRNHIKKENSCRSCVNQRKQEALGKQKCPFCRCYRPQEEFLDTAHCHKCLDKMRRKWARDAEKRDNPEYREKQRRRVKNYYWRTRTARRDYRKYYYYNIWKPMHTKILAIQWTLGLAKRRKVNRNGHWYMLNASLFKGLRQGKWMSEINRIAHDYLHKPSRLASDNFGFRRKTFEDDF